METNGDHSPARLEQGDAMSIFKRWFGRGDHQTEVSLAATSTGAPAVSAPDAGAESSVGAPDAVAADHTDADSEDQSPAERLSEQPLAVEVPLNSLTTYRRDPAFQNFVRKMKRPPGGARTRSAGLGDGYPL